jgi:thiol-disulfide isomerase/thioredoxin
VPLSTQHEEACPDIGPICDVRAEPPQIHDQTIDLAELRANLEFGLSARWALVALLPFRTVRTGIVYRNLAGDPITLDYENIHHRNETLSGIADPWILSRFGGGAGSWGYDLRAGLTLPLGKTQEDPFRAAELGQEHEHIQFGTGTVNPVLGFGFRRPLDRWMFDAWGIGFFGLYESHKGYEAGNRYGTGAGMSYRGEAPRAWSVRAGLEAQQENAEHWHGTVHRSDGNQGRKDLYLDTNGAVKISTDWFLTGTVKVPLATRVVGGELDFPAIFEIGFSRSFELHEESTHETAAPGVPPSPREEEPEGAAPAVDLAVVVREGEEAELVPVPGKVTVFDFWATWCVPCKELDRRLMDLLRRFPGLAVRKVNVVDWNSPIARRFLSGVEALPYVQVFGADGKPAFRRSGDPKRIAREVEKLLQGK